MAQASLLIGITRQTYQLFGLDDTPAVLQSNVDAVVAQVPSITDLYLNQQCQCQCFLL